MKRRKFVAGSIAGFILPSVSGCSNDRPRQETAGTSSDERDEEDTAATETPVGPTPNVSFMLEVINLYSEPVSIDVDLSEYVEGTRTASTDEKIYSKKVTLQPDETLDLGRYRQEDPLRLVIELGGDVVFDEQVENHEGYSIEILSESEIEVERKIS